MTKKDFFRILIKLFITYSLILSIFTLIPTIFSYAVYDLDLVSILVFIAGFLLIIALYYFAITNTDWFIKVLRLDKGYDSNEFTIGNITEIGIYKLAILIIGGFMIVDYFPDFINYSYLYFKKTVSPSNYNYASEVYNSETIDYPYWLIAAINILLGYLLITNNSRIATWASKK